MDPPNVMTVFVAATTPVVLLIMPLIGSLAPIGYIYGPTPAFGKTKHHIVLESFTEIIDRSFWLHRKYLCIPSYVSSFFSFNLSYIFLVITK
jgi:hypothetical protein